MKDRATTLRELYEMVEADDPVILDVPLSIVIHAASSRVQNETVPIAVDLWSCRRERPGPRTGAGHLEIDISLANHNLTKTRAR